MKRLFCAVCCLSLASLPALAAQHKASAKASDKTPMTDQQFVDFAGQTDMVEANLGQLAQSVAKSQAVQGYGKMLDTDHTNDYKQLQRAAKEADLTVPTAIDAQNNKSTIGPMHKLKGAAFDHRYIAAMIAGHTKAIALFKKEGQDATSPAIESYAQLAIPVLQKHLDGAQKLAKSKGR